MNSLLANQILPNAAPTKEEVRAALAVMIAVTETIREAGEVPEGPIYAALIGRVSLQGFQSMIAMLVRTGLVSKTGNMLKWTGPTLEVRK